ncbi:MAG: BLUF domain-containing protein [Beijerinckiaceae bacterium]
MIYRSRSLVDPTQSAATLSAIRSAADRRNFTNGVTGCLTNTARHFVQLLEGPAESVDETFLRIRRDDRHTDVEILLTRPIRNRAFADWCMAECDLSTADLLRPFSSIGLTPSFCVESTPPTQMLMLLMAIADQKRLAA